MINSQWGLGVLTGMVVCGNAGLSHHVSVEKKQVSKIYF